MNKTKSMLLHALRAARAMRVAVTRPPYVAPGHFYSPLTAPADTERALAWSENADSILPGVELAEERQLALFGKLASSMNEPFTGPRYNPVNNQYGPADGAVYRAMLNYLSPERLIEVGSGYSTAIALDEIDRGLSNMSLTCIEPYPKRLLGLLRGPDHKKIVLYRMPVQDVPLDVWENLTSGDVLFIDSAHVVKAGSDVNWLFLHVLPRLAPGVIVHVHDIFWPFEYSKKWLAERRDWTESYLLHAFLIGNSSWEIMLFTSWLWNCHPDLVSTHLTKEPGSIWLRRV